MILVAGGTGTLGAALVPRLVERNLPVRVLTRAGEAPAGVEALTGDIRMPADAAHLTMNELVERYRQDPGHAGTVTHVPPTAMRVASVMLRPVNPAMAELIHAALVMDTTEMTAEPHPLPG